jgi:hypothetical protein
VVLVLVLGAAGAAVFVFRDRIAKHARKQPPAHTNAPPVVVLNTLYPVPTNFTWSLNLTNAVVPDTPVAGRVHGNGFLCEQAILRGGLLSLNQGDAKSWDLGISVGLHAHQGEELSGKSVEIGPDRPSAPPIVLRWRKEQRKAASHSFTNGFALMVVFGQATNKHMPGKIYLCLPDPAKSFVAGTFDAEIKKWTPPKPPHAKVPKPKT